MVNLQAELRTDDAFGVRMEAHRRELRDAVAAAVTAGGATCSPFDEVVLLVVTALTGLMVSAVVDEPTAAAAMATALCRRWPRVGEPTIAPD